MDKDKEKNTPVTDDVEKNDVNSNPVEDKKDTSPEDNNKNEEVVFLPKSEYEKLMSKIEKIENIEEILKREQAEKKVLKFENIKQKYKLDDDLCDLLNINADTKEQDIVAKLDKFKKVVGENQKDSEVFFKTPATKTSNEDKIKQLIKEGESLKP